MLMSLRAASRAFTAAALGLSLSACSLMPWSQSSGTSPTPKPVSQPAPVASGDGRILFSEEQTALTPASSTASNMVRLDALAQSGCASLTQVDHPAEPVGETPQRWTARTCHGDLVYEVFVKTETGSPVVTVLPAGGTLDKPANPHFTPARPEGADNADAASETQASDAVEASPAGDGSNAPAR
ncbi:MAG: hypothetical protein WDN30_16415 [Pararobbsia sp.]